MHLQTTRAHNLAVLSSRLRARPGGHGMGQSDLRGSRLPEDEIRGMHAAFIVQTHDLKRPRPVKVQFEGDEKKLFAYWPQAFRWTCCGMGAEHRYGCDHNGRGSRPCSCDFCR